MAAIEVMLEPLQARAVPVATDPQPEDPDPDDDGAAEAAGDGPAAVVQAHA
jgi:hypothetical protein